MRTARLAFFGVTLSLAPALGCDSPPAPTADASGRAVSTASAAPKVASAKPSSAAVAPPTAAPEASEVPSSASAAPSASATAASASAATAAPNFPSEAPSAEPPTAEELGAFTKEIAVKASSEQQCSTKVLKGWFELVCGPADGLVRATKVDVEAGFDASRAVLEPNQGVSVRWVAPLPADGSLSRARFWGKGLHEIFLTLTSTENGWKGQLSGKRPAE